MQARAKEQRAARRVTKLGLVGSVGGVKRDVGRSCKGGRGGDGWRALVEPQVTCRPSTVEIVLAANHLFSLTLNHRLI